MKQRTFHVALIMDGNGRWAKLRGLERLTGHQAGAKALRSVIEAAPSCGITTLTAYAFSSDNWKRPADEVEGLMLLMAGHLERETPQLCSNGVRLSVIGRRDRLPARMSRAIAAAEEATGGGRRLHLQLAIDYSGREAIVRASQQAAFQPMALEDFGELLGQSPPVDLLIRTGGEQRLSDFLLWECAYAELLFPPCMWPDFAAGELRKAVAQFHRRYRRFGALKAAAEPVLGFAGSRDRWLH